MQLRQPGSNSGLATRGYQKNTVAMPNAISATAPSIRSRSSITPSEGERDMVGPLRPLDHPSSPTYNRTLDSASIGCLGKRRDPAA